MPKWSDFGNVWTTFREIDVNAIREEAEQFLAIVCVGQQSALDAVRTMLLSGPQRYGPTDANPLRLIALPFDSASRPSLEGASLLLIAIDARAALTAADTAALTQFERAAMPYLIVQIYGSQPIDGLPLGRTLLLGDPAAIDAADRLSAALLERLPSETHLSAARSLPALRPSYARDLINSSAFANATYALATGLPEQIPLISIPFAAADMLVLTKNQVMMVYRLALAHGAPAEFQARIAEVLPVVGGGFVWRQLARSLIGLIPIWGLVPKVAIAYAGTYTTGVAAWRWYAYGELISTEQTKRITQEAMEIGRAKAAELVERARLAGSQVSDQVGKIGLRERIGRLLPGRKHDTKTDSGE